MDPISKKVLEFYSEEAFNTTSSVRDQAAMIQAENQIASSYPDLHCKLASGKIKTMLDLGCGIGWLACTVAYYYPGIACMGVDFNPTATKAAAGLAAYLGVRAEFETENILKMKPSEQGYDAVVSLGVLHHLPVLDDGLTSAVAQLSKSSDALLYLGLYHSYGRGPFLEYARELRKLPDAFNRFRENAPQFSDNRLARSWFRDQILHPWETSVSFKEISAALERRGLLVESTSINHFNDIASIEDLFILEKDYEQLSRKRNFSEGRFFPGFFTVLANQKQRS